MDTIGENFLIYLEDMRYEVYYHLFSYGMSNEKLNLILNELKDKIQDDYETWFPDLHKRIRQTDFFDKDNKANGNLDMVLWYYIFESKEPLNRILRNFFEDVIF